MRSMASKARKRVMGYGIRVVLVMNRKGGSGKSTLCRALASAAAARGETVTIFDTDSSKSCLKWMQAGQEAGNWSSLVEVIHTLDVHRVVEAIGHIYEQQDQEHLILIDTFGGGSEAQDVLAVAAHCIICPMMLSRGDLSETLETASWYLILRNRVEKPEDLAGFTVTFSRVPARLSETERSVAEELFRSLPACEAYLSNRSAYVRMDREGLLGMLADTTPNRGLAAHLQNAVTEAGELLDEIDQSILAPAEVA
jgi:chromosome partitioning protein